MQTFTKHQLQIALGTLPRETQELLLSDTINFPLIDAMRDAKLSVQQQAWVGTLATGVLLGLSTMDDFVGALTRDVGLANDAAQQLAQNLTQNVFRLMQQPTGAKRVMEAPTQDTSARGVVGALRESRTSRAQGAGQTLASILDKTQDAKGLSIVNPSVDAYIRERWQVVPRPVRGAILDQDYKHAVRNAVSGHVLSEAEFGTLEEEVLMVLLGLQSKTDFARDLQSQVPSLTTADAQRVAGHIESHFFALLSPYLDETTPHPSPLPRGEGDEVPPPNLPLQGGGETTPSPQPSPAGRGSTTPLEQFIRKQADVQARFEKLPEEVRTTILSSAVADAFGAVVRSRNLTQEQFTTLGSTIVRVLVGLATTKDFRAILPTLGIPADTHDALATEVERGMFKPVRDAIVLALASRKNDGVA